MNQQDAAVELVVRSRAGDQVAMAMIAEMRRAALKGNRRAANGLRLVREYIQKHPYENTGFGFDRLPQRRPVNPTLRAQFLACLKNAKEYVRGMLGLVPKLGPEHLNFASAALANSVNLLPSAGKTSPRVSAIGDSLTPEDKKAYVYGMQTFRGNPKLANMTGTQLDAFLAGAAVGLARAIQTVRLPDAPIGPLSPMAAWELGE
jgi:hypothetical protein